jgi:pimeloyl-ACP methyl ester carboxylesterase
MHGTLAKPSHHLITQERVDSIIKPLMAADAHHSVLATSRNWHANRLEQDAHLIDRPTLIIWGGNDSVIPVKCGHILHREIPNSRLIMIKDCGHLPQEERPGLFTELVSSFCRDGI